MSAATTTTTTEQASSSTYRLKFRREEFMELISIANPRLVYRVKNFYYFSFDGFVMYSDDCREEDLMSYKIINAHELSNTPWVKK